MQGGPMTGQGMYRAPSGGTQPSYHRTERYSGPQSYTPGQRPANWNNRPRNFNPQVYHHNYRAVHRYHGRTYRRPPGWTYRRWTYGQYLPCRPYWGRDYWIDDFWDFGLDIPPYGYEWVQYGDDALLVSPDTGQVLGSRLRRLPTERRSLACHAGPGLTVRARFFILPGDESRATDCRERKSLRRERGKDFVHKGTPRPRREITKEELVARRRRAESSL